MLNIIYGNDREASRARFRTIRDSLVEKYGDERVVKEGEATTEFFEEVISSRGLFGEITLYIFDYVFDKKAEQEIFAALANELVSSTNHFLILEESLDKNLLAVLKETGAIIDEYSVKKTDARTGFNIFSLGDALGNRNKKELWVLYQGALDAGFEPEEICNTLFWAVKNIALMKSTSSVGVAGLSPYVAQKARGYAKNYKQEEIIKLANSLTVAYHEAHRGGEAMAIALERFILDL